MQLLSRDVYDGATLCFAMHGNGVCVCRGGGGGGVVGEGGGDMLVNVHLLLDIIMEIPTSSYATSADSCHRHS